MRIFTLFFLPFLFLAVKGQTQNIPDTSLTVGIELRPRAEFRNGAFTLKTPNANPAFFVSQRTRVTAAYASSALQIGLALQNIRVWGAAGQVAPAEGDNTMINAAWAQFEAVDNLHIKLGRQSLIYDDDRILGSLDWNQYGRWHDAAVVRFEPQKFKLHAAFAYNQNQENVFNTFYDAPGNYKTLQMLWYENSIDARHKFSALFLNTGFQIADGSENNMQTFGGNVYRTGSPLSLTGAFYFQTGSNAQDQDISAFLASLYGSYALNGVWGVGAGTDYLSGEPLTDSNPDETNAFNPLYGTHHKFYGLMDYFFAGSGHSNVGLWDKYAGVQLKPSPDLNLQLTLHHFNAAEELGPDISAYLGTEADLTFVWSPLDGVKWSGGYSQMLASESMEIVKSPGDHTLTQNWVWTMVTVNPVLFRL